MTLWPLSMAFVSATLFFQQLPENAGQLQVTVWQEESSSTFQEVKAPCPAERAQRLQVPGGSLASELKRSAGDSDRKSVV